MNNLILVIIIVMVVLFLITPKIIKEGYTSRSANLKEYAYSPSYEPAWMYNNWAYYNPYRYKYGFYPYFYKPRDYYNYGYWTPSGYTYYY